MSPNSPRCPTVSRVARSVVGLAVALGAVAGPVAPSVHADVDFNTLTTSLNATGDEGGSGSATLAMDPVGDQACYTIQVNLTDLAGDPPTLIDVHDQATGYPGDSVLTLTTSVDGTGSATGCVAADSDLVDSMLADAARYLIEVYTANYPDGAVEGQLDYGYPTGGVAVVTRTCPVAIQSEAALTDEAKATCVSVTLPQDDLSGAFPPGYTVVGYGGTATFDYHVVDGKHFDRTISSAERGGGGTCDSGTMTCTIGPLPYEWRPVGQGTVTVDPTVIPSGYRFGAAFAANGEDPGGPIDLQIDIDHLMSLDTTGYNTAVVTVYLFASADTTPPTVSVPTMHFATDAAISTSLPLRVGWSGSDPSGIAYYQIQGQKDGGSWVTLASNLHTTHVVTFVAPAHDYRYRVRARDKAGNLSAWKYSDKEHVLRYQDASPSITYSSSWHVQSISSAYGGTLHYASIAGRTATIRFYGQSVAWVAPESLGRGAAWIEVDGTHVANVSQYGPAAARIVQFSRSWTTVGWHTLKIKVVGTSGHPRIDVDAILVLR